MRKNLQKNKKIAKLLNLSKIYGTILIGAILSALGVSVFLSPTRISAGGLSGIGIIINSLWGFPIGTFMIIANIPIFLFGMKTVGKNFFLRSIFGSVCFSIFCDMTAQINPITDDLLLSAGAGGVLIGLGLGMILSVGASTGGSDLLARAFNKYFPSIDVGRLMFIIDIIITALGGIAFKNWDLSLYGAIALFISSRLIDFFIQGLNSAKTTYIISDKSEEIAAAILSEIERGISGIEITGMYSKKKKLMLMCILKKHEIPTLKRIVLSHDENAFIIFIGAHEVSGEGFKIYPIN